MKSAFAGNTDAMIGSIHHGASPCCWHGIPSLTPQLEASIRLAQPIPLAEWKAFRECRALQTIEYLQENPSIFQFDPDPKEHFAEGFIDPRVLTLSPSPKAEARVYYNSHISDQQQDITQDDFYYSLSDSSLDYSSSPYLAGYDIEDFLRCTVDEAQPATTVREENTSPSGQSPAHSLSESYTSNLFCSHCGKELKRPCDLR
ncbi:hypothetical protein GX51_03325 [Blastomyces parvus]|uniref:Uncharacterized protein n=1 Tax=Blastomyces parvus TaxID=2060905 RepID=A0A2B7X852_9EURO|nr:hypothetical protein GX51_03325 [Blastomyces parvus]